ncbi:transglycosylase domain-containing protein [Ornithinibacillus halophilus]|uniref:Penicillin-binding protein 1A n=1 Tax=Ornithinibacillus halophilus TaxID=930117 RepID=A0A1M5CMH5_9BACI|nr:PBP1A family penicillin-binding protein [Ornithinibacillus halophilus]SHF55964.1 penicillin-binding protein 1A [Ornithinibacillus halophilus]
MADNSQTRTARRKQKKAKKKPIWKKISLYVLIVFIVIGISVGGLFTYYVATAPEIDASKLTTLPSSKVRDKDGEVFADVGTEKRNKIKYEDLPDVLVDAVIATEDARFFDHPGIDLRRIGGAVIGNIRNGFGSEGASTITQQVVEKSFLQPDKKLSLKVQEQWLALKLDREYSKKEILEMYLNKIYYGAGAYGVSMASKVYFGKDDLHDLTLPEAAILAGLPQRPSAYDPFQNPDLTKKRMKTVLDLMVRHEKISQADADEAFAVDIESLLTTSRPDSIKHEAFIDQIERELEDKIEGANLYTDGLEIYTTLDRDAQEHVEFLLSDAEDNPIKYPDDEFQAGMVVLDSKTGEIRAIGGARGGLENRGHNNALNANRQPGSTIKPIVSYGPAIEYNKLSTYHQIHDDGQYRVDEDTVMHNFDNRSHGWMTMRTALAYSYNVPALKTLEENGLSNAQEFSEKLGIPITREIGEAIGGTTTNVNPMQLAAAYRPFANKGIYNEPYAITKVVYPDGRTIEFSPDPEVVMSEYTAYMISDMLKSVITSGSWQLDGFNFPVAGKTGTTNDAVDSWFAGYTTNYTISVWTGYSDMTPIEGSRTYAQQLFANTMKHISQDIETPDFTMPNSVVEVPVEKGSNPPALPSEYTPQSEIVTELFVKGTEPTSTSAKYDQIDPINNLKADFNKETNSIEVTWDYDSDEDVDFEISTSVNSGQMQVLSTTEEKNISISEVELGAEYEIQVIVISSSDDSNKSEPKSVTVQTTDDGNMDDEESEVEEREDENPGNIGSVNNLIVNYVAEGNLIDVSWEYNGPPAQFEVEVLGPNGNIQTYGENTRSLEISGVQAGATYTVSITPIGLRGANEGVRGTSVHSGEITIPGEDDDGEEE